MAAVYAFFKLREYAAERTVRELVAWSASADNHIRGNLSLCDYLHNAQRKLKLSREYCIYDDDERSYAKSIIEEYRQDLMQSYFKRNTYTIKSKYTVKGLDYFMFSLYAFLSDHQCDHEMCNQNMHTEQTEYKSYGYWGGPLYDATYALSDFAVVFHKMHYISYMYCRESVVLKALVPAWNEQNLKEILDAKQIEVSRY
jgi:hypothetical protein